MKRKVFLLGIAFLFVAMLLFFKRTSTAAGSIAPKGHQAHTIAINGLKRSYLVYVPADCRDQKNLPLVVMLHGMGGTAAAAVNEMGWSTKADEEGFIVVYPNASRPDPTRPPSLSRNPQAWNDGSGRFHAGEQNVDDVAFVQTLINQSIEDYEIDPERVLVTGFSNGASMAFRVGAEVSDRVTAIAPNAGTCWIEPIELSRGVSLCYMTGTADTLNPMEGGYPKLAFGGKEQGGKAKPSISRYIDNWIKANGCTESPTQDESLNGVRNRVYSAGRDDATVHFITVEQLGHQWAGGENIVPEFLVGKSTKKISATETIWKFFKASWPTKH
jgi:polyhydroxybutyrate depolymerase